MIIVFILIPGLFVLRVSQFRYTNPLDLILATAATGMAFSTLCVYLLLLANLYTRPTAALIILAPAAWLAWRYRHFRSFLPDRINSPAAAQREHGILDQTAIYACSIMLVIAFWDAATSPFRFWDGVVTWDKWATQWASRSHLYNCVQGNYPQLLPMFSSLLYKITGHYGAVVPWDQYALHAFHCLIAILLLIAVVRAAQVFSLPVWSIVLLTFAFRTTQQMIASGTGDILLTVFVLVTVVLYAGWQRRIWDATYVVPVWMLCTFGSAFVKVGGLLGLAFPVAASALGISPGTRRLSPKALFISLAVPVLLLVPFFIAQRYASQEPITQLPIQEVHFSTSGMVGYMEQLSNSAYGNTKGMARIQAVLEKLVADLSVPTPFVVAASVVVITCLGTSLLVPRVVPVFITTCLLFGLWYRFTSYDSRNLLPAIPLLAICVTAGGVKGYAYLSHFHFRWTRLVFAGSVAFLSIPVASAIVTETARLTDESLLRGNAAARIAYATAEIPKRLQPFFPHEYDMWTFLSRLRLLDRAKHVIADSVLYRWHPRGVYPLAHWNTHAARPGDLFIANLWPPASPPSQHGDWTMLRNDSMQAWIWQENPINVPLESLLLTGPSPPRVLSAGPAGLNVQAGGERAFIVHNYADRDGIYGRTIVWQAVVEADRADPALNPCSLVYDQAVSDPDLVRTATDANHPDSKVIKYSGVLAINPVPLSQNPQVDGILFGICRSGPPQKVKIRSFRYSVYRW